MKVMNVSTDTLQKSKAIPVDAISLCIEFTAFNQFYTLIWFSQF